MNQRVKSILDEVRKLTPDEQTEFMKEIWAVIDDEPPGGTPAEIEAAWDEEVARRIAAREWGEMETLSSDEVTAKARAIISEARARQSKP